MSQDSSAQRISIFSFFLSANSEYVWGKTNQRIAVEVVNERQKQTYFGALNYCTQEFLVQAYEKGNSNSTITFIEYLLVQYPQCRIAILWDGASYHRSRQFRDYLDALNQGREPPEWKITCICFAPNAPEQNPVEDIWLSAKRFVREFYQPLVPRKTSELFYIDRL